METKNKTERIYRMFADLEVEKRAEGEEEKESYLVKGYATTFDDPYVLYEWDGIKYSEQIDRNALNDADMSDVIFLYNHEGRVYARMRNNTLTLKIDEKGLYVEADLSSTEESRKLYEDIKTGLLSEMSWAFTVEEDSYNNETRTRTITKVKKVYDVSAVSIPANPDTSIAVDARSYFDGVIEEARRRDLELATARERVRAKLKL